MIEEIEAVINDIKSGRPIILVDNKLRENEADLILYAEFISEKMMAFFIRNCSGIVCLCLDSKDIKKLRLHPMSKDNRSKYGTPFTISIEAKRGVSSGVSAIDRTTTIKTAISEESSYNDIVTPGHVFPLHAHDDRLKGRRGHTEGAVSLMEISGLKPQAILCELMNNDGTMMRGDDLELFAKENNFRIVFIDDLV